MSAQPEPTLLPEPPKPKPRLKILPLETLTVVDPKPNAISHNIVFVVDASSSIYREPALQRKFERAWNVIVNNFASDELYFRVYVFNDKKKERRSQWFDAGGPLGLKKFKIAKKWILARTGTYSWGLKALKYAMREKCPLDKNKITARRLTIVLMTDGGFTEAAGMPYGDKLTQTAMENLAIKGKKYIKTGKFQVFDRMLAQEQAKRKKRGLDYATIVAIGIENNDPRWGRGVKQPNKECQAWLKKIGTQYGGGYVYVRNKPKKGKKKK